jgi:glycosyltransferase involved in cell wall biosynthesis
MIKRKILFITHTYPPKWDGVGRSVYELKYRFEQNQRYSVKIITTNYKQPGNKVFDSNIVFFNSFFKINDYPIITNGLIKIRKYVDWADVIICCETVSLSAYATFWGVLLRKKIIQWKHVNLHEIISNSIRNKYFAYIALLFSKTHSYIVDYFSETIILNGNFEKKKNNEILILPAIDKEKFIPANKKQLKRINGIDHQKMVISFIGRLAPEKGVAELKQLINAFHNYNHIQPIVVGDGEHGALFENIKHILYLKGTDEIEKIHQMSDIIIILSKTETGPLVLLEAMSCGVVPISTNVGLANKIIQEKTTGFIIDKNSEDIVTQVKTTIDCLLSNNKLLKTIQENNTLYAQQSFHNWEDTCNIFLKLVED